MNNPFETLKQIIQQQHNRIVVLEQMIATLRRDVNHIVGTVDYGRHASQQDDVGGASSQQVIDGGGSEEQTGQTLLVDESYQQEFDFITTIADVSRPADKAALTDVLVVDYGAGGAYGCIRNDVSVKDWATGDDGEMTFYIDDLNDKAYPVAVLA